MGEVAAQFARGVANLDVGANAPGHAIDHETRATAERAVLVGRTLASHKLLAVGSADVGPPVGRVEGGGLRQGEGRRSNDCWVLR